jgi:hypothetical protein
LVFSVLPSCFEAIAKQMVASAKQNKHLLNLLFPKTIWFFWFLGKTIWLFVAILNKL